MSKTSSIRSSVSAELRLATDRQTDRQTLAQRRAGIKTHIAAGRRLVKDGAGH